MQNPTQIMDRLLQRLRNRIRDEEEAATLGGGHGIGRVQVQPQGKVPFPEDETSRYTLRDIAPSSRGGSIGRGAATTTTAATTTNAVTTTGNIFIKLPPELQLLILEYLNFGEIERLRRTCRAIRNIISKPIIRRLVPLIERELLSTCYVCLSYEASPGHMVQSESSDARCPLANECFDCVAQRGGFIVGHKYELGDQHMAWVCRWCGYPICGGTGAWNQPEFHHACYRSYSKVLVAYFVAGCMQWIVTIIGSALCWRYFKETTVLAPTVTSFIMASWAFCLIVFRGYSIRTYHWSLIAEAVILALWVPPTCAIVTHIRKSPAEEPSNSTIATMYFIVINMVFRLFNVLGNLVLLCEHKRWQQRKPRVHKARRIYNGITSFLILWTYPQSIEQEYPGKWWFERRRPQPRPRFIETPPLRVVNV